MKRFDQLISDINVQLTILEAKAHIIPENHSHQISALNGNISITRKLLAPKIDENSLSGLTFFSLSSK